MMISTRGRYALRVLLDLAQHRNEGYVPMKSVAQRLELSLKYIERIVPVLTKNNMIEGVHGKGGGYKLSKAPDEYKIGDILRLTDGLAPVACLECNAPRCEKADSCPTLPLWKGFYKIANEYFDNITLEDLLEKRL